MFAGISTYCCHYLFLCDLINVCSFAVGILWHPASMPDMYNWLFWDMVPKGNTSLDLGYFWGH